MAISTRTAGWVKIPNALAGIPALGIGTGDPDKRYPLVFGTGACDSGRISTSTRAGAALTFPDAYSFGEAWELRWTFAESGNSSRQGVFLEVRQNAANTATIRGAEIAAAQCGAVGITTLEGANVRATARSTSTGNITNMYGITGEANFNSTCYTGTVSEMAAVRGKVTMLNGATLNNASVFLAEAEPSAGADTMNSIMRSCTHVNITFTTALDFSGSTLATLACSRVGLMKFKNSAGSCKTLVANACGVLAVI